MGPVTSRAATDIHGSTQGGGASSLAALVGAELATGGEAAESLGLWGTGSGARGSHATRNVTRPMMAVRFTGTDPVAPKPRASKRPCSMRLKTAQERKTRLGAARFAG